MGNERTPLFTGSPGTVAIFGSGETSASGRRVYDWLFRRMSRPIRVSVLETPAGFQPNSALVAQKVGDFLSHSLQNHRPQVDIVPARNREAPFSTEDESVISPILSSNVIFMGPGSPTYMVRQLQNSLAWHTVVACHRQGAALVLASAAAIAIGVKALPVYEIYKAGADLHWCSGLDLFAPYGLSLVFVSHWNNTEGGSELDTSHCYMGQARFDRLRQMLSPGASIVGIDEHTALIIDLTKQNCRVMGRGRVTLLRQGNEDVFSAAQSFPITDLGPFQQIEPGTGIPPEIWERIYAARGKADEAATAQPPADVLTLIETREKARARGDWQTSDALREQILDSGWNVADTPDGPRPTPAPSDD
jgi:cyanophycinase-like exopeptidase